MSRNGTTSVGKFFKHFGYSVAGWQESVEQKWNEAWFDGDFEAIFNSKKFITTQVFEDTPFWFPEFYKVLYHRFPNAKFILFTRNTEEWFLSLLRHNKGKVAGEFQLHCKVHAREKDYYKKIDANCDYNPMIPNQEHLLESEKHYKEYYEIRNREVVDFFKGKNPHRLIHCDLNDPDKWQKMGFFFDINIPENFKMHTNKSKKENREFVENMLKKKNLKR